MNNINRYIYMLLAITFCTGTICSASERAFSIDDLIDMKSVGGNFQLSPDGFEETVLISPDGQQVFYSVSSAEWETNQRVSRFYTVDSQGGSSVEMLALQSGSLFQYSPGGTYLSFLKPVANRTQVFIFHIKTGQLTQLSHHATDVFKYIWSDDESNIYFLADDARSAEEQREYEMGATWFSVDDGPNGRIAARWRNLWQIQLADSAETQITSEKLILDEFDVSPDGDRMVFVARPDNRRNYPHTAEMYMLDIARKSISRMTENLAPESMLLWSPDGKQIAYYAPDDKVYKLTKGYLWLYDVETGSHRQLKSQNMGDIYTLTWSIDSKSLLFSEVHRTNIQIFRLILENDSLQALTKGKGSTMVLGFSSDQNRMVYTYTDFDTPLDIYSSTVDKIAPVRLTHINPWIDSDIALGQGKVIKWKSKDGLEIEGVLSVPAGYSGEEKLPLLVINHGGPNMLWANEFYYVTHLYNGLGYAVLGANIRGSSGYGDDFIQALIGDLGGGGFEDIMSGVDYVIDAGIADPDRLAVRGWSWGGVLASWTITQTQRFKAASIGAGVMSWLSEMGPGFNWDLTEWYMEKSHWEDPEAWREVSSITYVQNVTTPSLIIHGDDDWFSSYNQSLIFFTGLRDIGKAPARFISYPGGGHEKFEPWGQRARYKEEISWFQKYVNEVEWQAPARE